MLFRSMDVSPGNYTVGRISKCSKRPSAFAMRMSSTMACAGPRRVHSIICSSAAGGPAITASTVPSVRLRTQPVMPSARADSTMKLRKPTRCTRPLMIKLGEQLGQTVVQDNRVGLGGSIAALQLARSAPDGYTLSLVTIANFVQRFIQKDLGYDPYSDLAHVTQLTLGGSLLVVPADSPLRSVEDLIAAARAAPGKLNYG